MGVPSQSVRAQLFDSRTAGRARVLTSEGPDE